MSNWKVYSYYLVVASVLVWLTIVFYKMSEDSLLFNGLSGICGAIAFYMIYAGLVGAVGEIMRYFEEKNKK